MNNTSAPSEGTTKPFVEYHYYSGGLRTNLISLDNVRPDWAPPSDWVGFRDEVTLEGDDVAIEIVKFSVNRATVSWIGVYRRAPDEVYGDRQNHAGLGIWLYNAYPSAPAILVQALRTVLGLLNGSDKREFEASVRALLKGYVGGYVSKYAPLPSPLGGVRSASSQSYSTSLISFDITHNDLDSLIDEAFFRAFFFARDDQISSNRLIITLSSQSRHSSAELIHHIPLSRVLFDFCSSLPDAFEAQSSEILGLHSDLEAERVSLLNVSSKHDDLRQKLADADLRAAESERRCAELQELIEGSDEIRRHDIIAAKIDGSNDRMISALRDLDRFKANFLAEMKAEIRAISSSRSTQYLEVRNSNHQRAEPNHSVQRGPNTSAPSANEDDGYDFGTKILYAIVAIGVIIAIGLIAAYALQNVF